MFEICSLRRYLKQCGATNIPLTGQEMPESVRETIGSDSDERRRAADIYLNNDNAQELHWMSSPVTGCDKLIAVTKPSTISPFRYPRRRKADLERP